MGLSFGQLDALLAKVTGIADDKRHTFQSRLKTIQKMGYPPGVNVGRGVKMDYGFEHLLHMVFLLDILDAGVPPDRAIRLLVSEWEAVMAAAAAALRDVAGEATDRVFLLLAIDALGDMKQITPRVRVRRCTAVDLAEAARGFRRGSGAGPTIVFDVSMTLQEALVAMALLGYDFSQFSEEVRALDERGRRFDANQGWLIRPAGSDKARRHATQLEEMQRTGDGQASAGAIPGNAARALLGVS